MVAAALRVWTSLGELWLDEIWSYLIVKNDVTSPWQLFTLIRHENNHILNSLFFYALGPDRQPLVYRLPAVLAGTVAVGLAGAIARREGSVAALTAMALAAVSYLLVHYSSEARGYGPVVCFALLAFWLMERDRPVAFGVSCVLGFLAHPMFVYFYASAALWQAWRLVRANTPWRPLLATLAAWHALPVLFVLWLWAVNLRHMVAGEGTVLPLGAVLLQTLSLAGGGPDAGPLAVAVAAAVVVAFVAGLVILRRDDLPLFYLGVVCVAPAAFLVATHRPWVYPRYFVIGIAFFLILLAHVLARVWERSRLAYAALLLAFVAGNAVHVERLGRLGRGAYLEALAYMQHETAGPEMTVGGDHAFRHSLPLAFYERRLDATPRLAWFAQGPWPPGGTEWVLRHAMGPERPAPEFTDGQGNRYRLVREYPYAGLSGWALFVYRNERGLEPPAGGR